MTGLSYAELVRLAAPEALIILGALLCLTIDMAVLRDQPVLARLGTLFTFASATCVVAVLWMVGFFVSATLPAFEVSRLTQAVKVGLLLLAAASLWAGYGRARYEHAGEYACLMLLSTAGMMLLVSSRDLVTFFVSLELSTVPLYVLAGFDRHKASGTLASLRYFLFGGMSSAITLYGLSLLYGFSSSIEFSGIVAKAATASQDPLLLFGTVMLLAGLGFKLASAPFHLWAPEVYSQAPASSAGFIGSASKLAAIIALAVVVSAMTSGESLNSPAAFPVAALAVLSIVVGNLAALIQSDLRRLIAFSAVGHAGYMLLATLGRDGDAMPAAFYYAFTYGIATLGALVCAGVVSAESKWNSAALGGLGARNPFLSVCLLLFMLSLAGIPPLAGFTGKFIVFSAFLRSAPLDAARWALLLIALAGSAISLYYYLRVLKQVYVRPSELTSRCHAVPLPQMILLGISAAALLVLGIAPQLVLRGLLNWAGAESSH